MPKFIIVGAGITGLTLARKLSKTHPETEVLILEKSRGLGGRLATRRGESTRFDHGISEITESDLTGIDISARDFRAEGATAIAKHLADGLWIEKNTRAETIQKSGPHWILKTECGKVFSAETIVVTAPLPQALELLEKNRIPHPPEAKAIGYEMAVVALLEGAGLPETETVLRNLGEDFLTLADEKRKGISKKSAWTLTFSPAFSRRGFDLPEEDLKREALRSIREKFPGFSGSLEIKKWRYSKPEQVYPAPFLKVSDRPDLYLAGDGFSKEASGTDLQHAIGSALELSFEILGK